MVDLWSVDLLVLGWLVIWVVIGLFASILGGGAVGVAL